MSVLRRTFAIEWRDFTNIVICVQHQNTLYNVDYEMIKKKKRLSRELTQDASSSNQKSLT